MSILGNDLLLAGTDEGYNLTRSLRTRASASASLNRTPASAGNRQKFTLSFWTKRGAFISSDFTMLFYSYASTSDYFGISFDSLARLNIYDALGGLSLTTTPVYRDPSAWYHFVIAIDTTQATAANRVKIYVNSVEVTAWAIQTYPAQNTNLNYNSASIHRIAASDYPSFPRYYDGYLTEVNFIDGQALTPSSFGETDTTTGVWKPKRYAGTYGTNGFYLPFTDNSALTTSSNAGLGKDFSGNGNYWVTNNISITAGVTYDSMTDVPTLTSATAANFAVLNPLSNYNCVVANGNLQISYNGSAQGVILGSIGITSGKWYWENTITALASSIFGVYRSDTPLATANVFGANAYGYVYNGVKITNLTTSAYGAAFTTNDVIGVALDMDAGTIAFYKNGVSQGTAFTGLSGRYFPACDTNEATVSANFGQRPFAYTPPSGYKALNTYNLPDSTIVKGNTVMDATIWTGDGSSPRTITNSAGFKPDLVWAKNRSTSGYWNVLFDSVRGAGNQLSSNETDAELASASNVAGKVSAFNSNGFSLATGSSSIRSVNGNTETYVGWQWQAGQGTTSSNTSGTITSTVSVNASAGFSVVTYTGTGANATVGHGLGVTPSLIICKARSTTGSWQTYHSSIGNTSAVFLNLDSAAFASSVYWNNTSPTSSVFSIGTSSFVNVASQTQVAYCFAPIAGFSAFGSYTGNGSTDGPFIYTGFRPKFVMCKVTSTSNWWIMFDSTRNPYNAANYELNANLSDAEYTANTSQYTLFDFLSNGFKLRTGSLEGNSNGQTYIYMAFAENPFKNALAR